MRLSRHWCVANRFLSGNAGLQVDRDSRCPDNRLIGLAVKRTRRRAALVIAVSLLAGIGAYVFAEPYWERNSAILVFADASEAEHHAV
jgi:hypothetical protein